MKVCVYAICKNESKFVERWMNSMGEADCVIVLDTGSTDDTVAKLRAAGAEVHQERIEPWRFDVARNRSMALVPDDADICVCTDLDEVFHAGWREKLERAWKSGTTRASYRYTWNFREDGSEDCVFWIDKIHARTGYEWKHPVHEVLVRTDAVPERCVNAVGIQLDHHADPSKSRGQYLPLLELSVKEAPNDDRNVHYLGREYLFYGQWDRCIETLKRHLRLPNATWADERCASMRYIARAYLQKGNIASAKTWYWRAIAEAPHLREPYVEMARLMYEMEDWEGVTYMTQCALAIRERTQTYISEGEAWGSLPWDLRALGLFYTNRKEESLVCAQKAAELSPQDERLRKNIDLIGQSMTVSARSGQ